MLRLLYHTSRPTLRTVFTHQPCRRLFHSSIALRDQAESIADTSTSEATVVACFGEKRKLETKRARAQIEADESQHVTKNGPKRARAQVEADAAIEALRVKRVRKKETTPRRTKRTAQIEADEADRARKIRTYKPRRTEAEIEVASAIDALQSKESREKESKPRRPRRSKAQIEEDEKQAPFQRTATRKIAAVELTQSRNKSEDTEAATNLKQSRAKKRTEAQVAEAEAQAILIREAVVRGEMSEQDAYAALKNLGGRIPLRARPQRTEAKAQSQVLVVENNPRDADVAEGEIQALFRASLKHPELHVGFENLPKRQQKLLRHLYKAYGGSMRRNPACDVRRVNVVGADLCDAILERMSASLEKHKGCDIIDVNPGAGLWSSRLHDLLKPRTHVLMEPDSAYEPVLQSLLDDPKSTFKLFAKPGIIWGHLEKAISKQFLPHQEELSEGDPRHGQPNDTLLFIANLAYYPKRTYRSFSSLTHLVLHQLLTATRSNSLFQRYGQVRMLIWFTDQERYIALPRHIALRRKSSLEADLSCGSINEVASSTRPVGIYRRDEGLELEKAAEVIRNMEEHGISTPEDRKSFMQRHLSIRGNRSEFSLERADKDRVGSRYLEQLKILEEKFEKGEITKYSNELNPALENQGTGKRGKSPEFPFKHSPQYEKLLMLRSRKMTAIKRGNIVYDFATRHDEIMDVEREIYNGDPNEATYASRREHLTQLLKDFKDDLGKVKSKVTLVEITTYLDEKRLMQQPTPGFVYDRRSVEPLMTRPSDFFPQHELALLDFQPQSIWPILRENFPANYDEFEYIMSTIFTSPSVPVPTAIKSLWPGAEDWILPRCPTLANPNRGGDMDVSRLTVRCLTLEMMKEVFEAWMSWPFKPSRMELIGRLSDYEGSDVDIDLAGDGEHA